VLENVEEEHPARSEADVMVLTRRQDITGRGEWLMNIDFVAVAHRDHPLSALTGRWTTARWPLAAGAHRRPQQRPAIFPRCVDVFHH
jgi:hypothetical protein